MSNILSWGNPPKAKSVEAWKSISADGAPPGVYTPNMSTEHAKRWRAKLVGTRSGNPQIEIRRQHHANIVVIVAGQNGYKHKGVFVEKPHVVQLSMNSPEVFTPTEFKEFFIAVEEARAMLICYEMDPKATLARLKTLKGE